MMMRTLYRLRFKDGSISAWDADLERIKKDANFFRATIESKEFIDVKKLQEASK